MKLSKLKPCSLCGRQLLNPPIGNWYVLRVSTAMLNPQYARSVIGLSTIYGGALGLAELMAPAAEKAVMILGDEDKQLMTELHICFDCYCDMPRLMLAVENANQPPTRPASADPDANVQPRA